MSVVYALLSVAGLVGTWFFNLRFLSSASELGYLEAWFVNDASSSAAVDIIVMALAASIFMLVEGFRLGLRVWALVLVPLSFAVAVAFTFPLFLAVRQRRLRHLSRERAAVAGDPLPAGGIA